MAKRKANRVSMFLPVQVRDEMLDQTYQGSSRDISKSGIQVLMPEMLVRGECYDLTFSFPGVVLEIRTRARCVRTYDLLPISSGSNCLVSFEFLDMVDSISSDLERSVQRIADDIHDFLVDHEPFSGIKESVLDDLVCSCRRVELKDGDDLSGEIDLMNSFIMVRSGLVKFYKPGFRQGWEKAVLGTRGSVLGEQAILANQPHGLRIMALDESELLVVSSSSFTYINKIHPATAQSLKRILTKIAQSRQKSGYGSLFPLGLEPAFPSL